ncbi:hypothetical protein bcgnr5378_36470 [Bacillus cereus]|uniref:Long-chain-fatty-acid--CoA ligase n=1 Tax=Bacillus cereus TaxID=1396 RepID=A0A164QQ41_BACCE|nr:AMP-binding protein [Bacillus cereus]KZD72018.1 Long-chain-fatty-acid--CoA ligase [Bacillus cereus]HDR8320356.1 AMP-binding protein [Bacillus cereus]HDR8328455.1 AMP-binding protein [Bacillus cereus]HDR8334218.1 AMP-binding protein [Bacillus cereus]
MLRWITATFKKYKTENWRFLFKGKTVLFANYTSFKDIVSLHEKLPSEVVFALTKNEDKEVQNTLGRRKICVYDRLEAKSLELVKKEIEQDNPVLIFIEGEVRENGSMLYVQDEWIQYALNEDVNVIPIHVIPLEDENLFVQGNKIQFPSKKTVEVTKGRFGRTIETENKRDMNVQEAGMLVMDIFRDMLIQKSIPRTVNLYNCLVTRVNQGTSGRVKDEMADLSYGEFLRNVNVFSHMLKGYLSSLDKVGVLLPTSVVNSLILFSLFKLQKTPALLNYTHGAKTMLHCVETAELSTVITSKLFIKKAGLNEIVEELKEHGVEFLYVEDMRKDIKQLHKLKGVTDTTINAKISGKEQEVILFTSGSENKPKGVVLTHRNLFANIRQALSVIEVKKDDVMCNVLPMFHCFGLTVGTLLPILEGISLVLHPNPLHYKGIPKLIRDTKTTILFGTATFFLMYGKNAKPYELHRIRIAITGAEKLQNEVSQMWMDDFGVRVLEGYGLSEASPIISVNTHAAYRKSTVGRVFPGIGYQVKQVEGIDDGGTLLIKGPNLMKGYLLHGKGFVPHTGWYDTGDVVEVDGDGFLKIVARLKRFAKIGGEMVSLQLVEDLAQGCYPQIQVAAVSVTDKKKGEKVILFTTDESVNLRDLKKHIKNHKESALYVPKTIHFVESLPLLGSGKVNYVELTALAEEKEV